ncbi:O-antigen ligase family protein [Sphingomonas faeni]|uniref:O-antigen ligase family protein n=1 Tax=Sphingomonas faeni TaxID=185950 RepID=UPI0027821125|nr:O-antigen ligase family protein [Sphingomonas faeni]MDQ0838832.1 O-antigen ligase [Sphingomonas faeni]
MTAARSQLPETFPSTRKVLSTSQYIPFALFFLLICTPGVTNIASINFSIALFPFVLYGYSTTARDAFYSMLPGARNLGAIILSLTLLICGWSLITAIGVDSFVRVFRPIYGHASGIAIVLAIFALSRSSQSARRTQILCLVILTLSLSATYFLGQRGYGDRYPGFFKHPNQLGPVASMAGLFFVCQALSSPLRKVSLPLVGLLVAIYAIFLSGSKTNLVSFAVLFLISVPLMAFQRLDPRQALAELSRNISIALGAIIGGALILPLINARAFTVLDTIFAGDEEVNQYGSVLARKGLWQESWDMALAHPMTGVGAGQLMSDGTEHAHNVFMDAVRTTGFPGLGLTITFILAVLWYFLGAYGAARQVGRDDSSRLSEEGARGPFIGSLMALISYIVSNQMSDSFGPSTIPFFYMFLAFSMTYFLPRYYTKPDKDWV